jgi:hypothetical protein
MHRGSPFAHHPASHTLPTLSPVKPAGYHPTTGCPAGFPVRLSMPMTLLITPTLNGKTAACLTLVSRSSDLPVASALKVVRHIYTSMASLLTSLTSTTLRSPTLLMVMFWLLHLNFPIVKIVFCLQHLNGSQLKPFRPLLKLALPLTALVI